MEEENEPILVINPKFNMLRYILVKYALSLLAIIVIMVIVVNVSTEYNFGPSFLVFIFAYIVYILIRAFLNAKSHKLLQYLFYTDKLIILNDNKNGRDIVINYSEMVDILILQDYIQKFYDQGDLIIKLTDSKLFAKTVTLIGIENYKETVNIITGIVYEE